MPSEGHLYAAAAPSLTTAISVAVAAGESLLTAAVLAIAGIYMTRSGFMGQEVTRGLAALQMRCLMPCLLFSRVLPAVSPRLLVLNWPMLLLPLAMVPIGVVGRVLLGPALVDAESWRLGAGPGLLAPLPMDWAGAGVAGFALGAAWGRSFLKPASNGQNVASDAVSG